MKILLTGHQGFIGSVLQDRLLSAGHNVHGIDLLSGDDLLTCELPNQDFDLIIHLAGRSGVRESINDPSAYWMNNVEASRRVFTRYPDTRILYASSSSAYEPDLNPYAASKFVLEELAERYPHTLGLRLHTVWSDTPRKGMFVEKLMNNTLTYVTRHHRDFVHIEDVIDAIEILIEKDYINGTIDVGNGFPIKVQNFAPDSPIRLNTPGERDYTCANTEMLSSLGWKPKYDITKHLTFVSNDNKIVNINGD